MSRMPRAGSGQAVARAFLPALALVALTACGAAWIDDGPRDGGGAAESTGASGSASGGSSTSVSSPPRDSPSVSVVSCHEDSCSVLLGGSGSAYVFGTAISIGGVRDGHAILRVEEQAVPCPRAGSVSAGPVTVTCTDVTTDTVEFTVSPG